MNQNNLVDEPGADLLVARVLRLAQDDSKLVSKVLQTLVLSLHGVCFEAPQQELDTICEEGVLVVPHHDTLEDFLIGRADKAFEDEHDGYDVLLLAPAEAQHCRAIGEIVQGVRHRRLVWSNTADLDSMRCVGGPTVLE
jgi:hypothetical protein